MKQFNLQITGVLLLVFIVFQPVQASDKISLENRIQGWVSAVNEGNYYLCLTYVAPHTFAGQIGLSRKITRGGEELLLFSGDIFLPLSEYQINKIAFLNNGYESKVTIYAKVIYQRNPLYIKQDGAIKEYDMLVYPATITQRWILLNGKWFITSMFRIQYLGSS